MHYDIVSGHSHMLTLLPVCEKWCEAGEVEWGGDARLSGCCDWVAKKREARLLLEGHLEGPMKILLRRKHPIPTTSSLDFLLPKHSRILSHPEQIRPIHVKPQSFLQRPSTHMKASNYLIYVAQSPLNYFARIVAHYFLNLTAETLT